MLATYLLCGFANFSALAMQIGGLGSLFPERRDLIAEFGMKSLLGGTLTSLMSACIAGILL
jgi:CNT family concentrative nucleoside transporter